MNDFAVWQMEMDRADDACGEVLRTLEIAAETWDMSPRELLGVLVMAEMRIARNAGISHADFAALSKIRQGYADLVLK
jgi:hypothetical protein